MGIYENNRLIDTLKKIVGTYSSKKDSVEDVVKQFFDTEFSSLSKLTSYEKIIFFVNPKGNTKFIYFPESKILKLSNGEFLRLLDLFDIDEDSLHEIFKSWFKDNFDVDISYIDYYF